MAEGGDGPAVDSHAHLFSIAKWGNDAPLMSHDDRIDHASAPAPYRAALPHAAIRRTIGETALALFFT